MSDPRQLSAMAVLRQMPARTLVAVTTTALCVAMVASWYFVIRPATHDTTSIKVEDLVDSAALGTDAGEPLAVGDKVPPVEFAGLDGPDIALSEFSGRPVIVNFWASTCAPCVKEMPLLERASRRYGEKVAFVGIDVFESEALGRAMVAKTGVTYRQGRDPASTFISRFGGLNLPHTVVIDANGIVTALHNRAFTADAEVDDLIAAAR